MDQSEPTGDPGTPAPPAPPPRRGWAAPPPPPVQTGPAGFVYADVPNRAIAYIIDAIIVGIVAGDHRRRSSRASASRPGSFAPGTLNFEVNFVGLIVSAIVGAAISAAYFVYTWTSMRGTLGMKVLGHADRERR